MKRLTVLCALGAVAGVPAFASDNDVGGMYVTPMIGDLHTDKDRPASSRDNAIGSLALGKHLSEAWSAEVLLNGVKIRNDDPAPNQTAWAGSLDLLRVFNRAGNFSPYLGLGGGVIENDLTPGAAGSDAMAQVSLGAFWTVWEGSNGDSFALRPDFKARWEDAHSAGRLTDYIGQIGFQYTWGGMRKVSAAPPPPPPPPPAAVAPAPPPPPVTPAPPGDEDQDGVTDDRDRCPGTPRGVAVDANGCPQKGSITLEGVTFDYNSATLTQSSLAVLDTVAEGLKKYPRLKVELQGHTDSRGPDAYNLTLSEKRADAVREYLLKDGVPSSQMSAKGYGEAQPIADNKTDEGRARNRRVVMFVLENPGDVDVKGAGDVK
jgi:OOP family OmpA-OmpF porin